MIQSITEAEAREKWCPMMLRDISVSSSLEAWRNQHACLASRCMAWRWQQSHIEQTGELDDDDMPMYRSVLSTTHGHCGLAR